MNTFTRRRFLQASVLGFGSLMAPAVMSYGVSHWPKGDKPARSGLFLHGVASGDPLSDAVILWTRVTPALSHRVDHKHRHEHENHHSESNHSILVGWEVATDAEFHHLVRKGNTPVTSETDYTLKVDVRGLRPAKTYYYRFHTHHHVSSSGVTRTLPAGDVSQVKFAVLSCANYPAGFFNVYQEASYQTDLDAVIHLGDYIYEYGAGGYATQNANSIGRGFNPANEGELLTLSDYRLRYAQYRTDQGLQALHATAPFICVWDDHEIANDTWKSGAENHNAGEGDFILRKSQAIRAYFEWMPIRPVARNNQEIIYRRFEFGNLVNLMMLDTRVIGRDQQLDYANYISSTGDFNAAQFVADVSDTNRTLMGFEQRDWLLGSMAASSATWQVLGQQVLMGRMNLPAELLLNLANPASALTSFSELVGLKMKYMAGADLTAVELARLNQPELPYNLDAWDGYATEREIVLGTSYALQKNLLVLAGDTHNAWANNLHDINGNAVGVEFATPSVTSPGLEEYLSLPQAAWPQTEFGFQTLIKDLQYANLGDRGFMTITLTPQQAIAEWHFVSTVLDSDYQLLDGEGDTQNRNKILTVKLGENQIA